MSKQLKKALLKLFNLVLDLDLKKEFMILEFEIPGLPKMTNGLRVHWRAIQKERKTWKERVAIAVAFEQKRAARPFITLSHAKVTLTRFSARPPDYDGLVSSFKAILDGLVEAQVIIDDNVTVIGQPIYLWAKAPPSKGKIKVRIESTEVAA